MKKPQMLIAFLALWLLVSVKAQEDGDFWWLKVTTDGPQEPTATPKDQPPCECVEYYLCINGTIGTSGVGIIDVRVRPQNRPPPPRNRDLISETECPDLYDVCCAPPPPVTPVTNSTTPETKLPPDTPCECVSFINCTEERLVSDGLGNTSIEAYGFAYSHSACPHVFTVCCALEPTNNVTTPRPVITTPPSNIPSHCDCVEPYLCDIDGTIITSGAGLMDLRNRHANPNPGVVCENPQQVCCNKPVLVTSPPNVTTASTTATTQSPPTTLPNCGSRNEMGIAARILGFREGESQFGEFPWVTAVLRQEVMMNKTIHLFVGGGTLIHPKVVITAAHKVHGIRANKLWVRLGEWDTQQEYEAYIHQDTQVEEIVIHPNFDPRALFNDIALLFLREEARKEPHINHICTAEDIKEVNTSACIINGWGKNGFETGSEYQKIMKSLMIPLVDRETCQAQLRKTRLGKYFSLDTSFLCAGGELGKDACTGDGGGPLACPRLDNPKRYLLVGITAWGIGCGQDGIPGVYASVPSSYSWIRDEIYGRYPPTTTTATTTDEDFDYGNSYQDSHEDLKDPKSSRWNQREQRKWKKQERQRHKEERRRQRLEERDSREDTGGERRHQRQQFQEERRQERQEARQERNRRREERRRQRLEGEE